MLTKAHSRLLGWCLTAAAWAQTTTVDVIVTGRDDLPVTGLTASDFRVTEDKQPRKLLAAAPLASGPRGFSTDDSQLFSNRGPETQGSLIVVVLDALNTAPAVLVQAQAELAKALERTEFSGRLGVLYFDGALFRLGPFGNAPAEQAALVRNWKRPPDSETRRQSNYRESANAFQTSGDTRQTPLYQVTAAALDTIAQSLAAVEGRKSLLWVSSSFPFALSVNQRYWKPERNSETLQHGLETAQRTNLAIYPVALVNVPPFPQVAVPSMNQRAQILTQRRSSMTGNAVGEIRRSQLETLRATTGGRVLDIDDLRFSLEAAVADSRAVYRLVFESPPAKTSELRPLRIEIPGRDVRVVHRSATPYVVAGDSESGVQRTFERIATSPLEATAVAVGARKGASGLRLSAGPDGLLGPDGRLAFDVAIALLDDKGTVVSWSANHFEIDLPGPARAGFARKGIEWDAPVGPAARYRIIVRDQRSGLAGSVTVPGSEAGAPNRFR